MLARARALYNRFLGDNQGYRPLPAGELQAEAAAHPDQAKLMLAQLKPYYIYIDQAGFLNFDELENDYGDALDKTDVGYHTFLRLWQVFSYVISNYAEAHIYSDTPNPNSSYEQALSHDGVPVTLASLIAIPLVIGVFVRYYIMRQERHKASMEYKLENLQRVDSTVTKDSALRSYNSLLRRNKVQPRHLKPTLAPEEEQHAALQDAALVEIILDGPFHRFRKRVKEFAGNLAQRCINEVKPYATWLHDNFGFVRYVASHARAWWNNFTGFFWGCYDILGKMALVFWPTWMTAVIRYGLTAIKGTILAVVVLVTVCVSVPVIFGFWAVKKIVNWNKNHPQPAQPANRGTNGEPQPETANDPLTNEVEAEPETAQLDEIKRMKNELTQRLYMKTEHGKFKEKLERLLADNPDLQRDPARLAKLFPKLRPYYAKEARETDAAYKATVGDRRLNKDELLLLVRNKSVAEQAFRPVYRADHTINPAYVNQVLRSKLGKNLVGTPLERNGQAVIYTTNETVNGYTLASFIFWLAGAVLTVVVPVLTPLAYVLSFVNDAWASTITSAVLGAKRGLNTYTNLRVNQLKNQREAFLRLTEVYKPENINDGKHNYAGCTKQVAFEGLAAEVAAKKAALLERQKDAREKQARGEPLSASEQLDLSYDLNDVVDVYKDHWYFKNQKRTNWWDDLKLAAFLLFKGSNAGQTWIFALARSLFLPGAILAGVLTFAFGPAGAAVAFIVLAVAFAVIGIAFKFAQIRLERQDANRKACLDTLEARLSYLEKKKVEFEYIDKFRALEQDRAYPDAAQAVGVNVAPAPTAYPPVVPAAVPTAPAAPTRAATNDGEIPVASEQKDSLSMFTEVLRVANVRTDAKPLFVNSEDLKAILAKSTQHAKTAERTNVDSQEATLTDNCVAARA